MQQSRPRIVIVGAGFGGLFAAQALGKADAHVTIVDRHNYHLFQPLLYQVAVAGLAPSDIAWPVRAILRRQRNASVLMDEVIGIETAARLAQLRSGSVEYDYLVIATGSTHSYFGHDDWEDVAPGLKNVDDATRIRRRILTAFERAEMTGDVAERDRLLRFVIVGAGPTGVELAGTIAELARHTLVQDFRRIDPKAASIILVEAGERVLPAFHESLSAYAKTALERLGVDVRLGSPVTGCDRDGVVLRGERVPAATVIWAAGVAASPVGRWLGVETARGGRVRVAEDLSMPGLPEVFVIGDAALVLDAGGRPLPGVAPVAKQQGRYVGRLLRARLAGESVTRPFRYRDYGQLATIGRSRAVIDFRFLRLKGWLAWWIWGIAHIYFLVGVPSPLVVSIRWLWEYLTYGRGARLITGSSSADNSGDS